MKTYTLRELRRKGDLTIEETSVLSLCSITLLSRAERGLCPISPEAAERLARLFGVDPAALLAGQDALRSRVREELEKRLHPAEAAR